MGQGLLGLRPSPVDSRWLFRGGACGRCSSLGPPGLVILAVSEKEEGVARCLFRPPRVLTRTDDDLPRPAGKGPPRQASQQLCLAALLPPPNQATDPLKGAPLMEAMQVFIKV